MANAIQVDNSAENLNWMRSLPGYASELQLHRDLAKQYGADPRNIGRVLPTHVVVDAVEKKDKKSLIISISIKGD